MKMHKTKLRHRVLALTLALMLCLSMLNLTAFAAEGDEVGSEPTPAPVEEVVTNPDPAPVVEPEPETVVEPTEPSDPVDPADEPTEEQPKTEEGANNAEPKVEEPAKKPVEPAGDAVSGVENDTPSTDKAVTKVVNKVRAGGNAGRWPQQYTCPECSQSVNPWDTNNVVWENDAYYHRTCLCRHTVGQDSTLSLGTWHGERGRMYCKYCEKDILCPHHKDNNTSTSGERVEHDHECDYCHLPLESTSEWKQVFVREDAPTCTQPGQKLYACSYSGGAPCDRLTEFLPGKPALGHDFTNATWVDNCTSHRDETCTGHTMVCTRCHGEEKGEVNGQGPTMVAPHDFNDWSDWANCDAPAGEETPEGAQWQSHYQECKDCHHIHTKYRLTMTPLTFAVSYDWNLPTGAEAPNGLPETEFYSEGTSVSVKPVPENVTVKAADGITYKLTGWTADDVTVSEGAFTMPGKPVTLNGVWEKVTAEYTVQYLEKDSKKSLKNADTRTGDFGTEVSAISDDKANITVGNDTYEYVADGSTEKATLAATGTVLTLYFQRVIPEPTIGNINIEKTASATNVNVGENVTFTIVVTNDNEKAVTVDVSDVLLPGELEFVSASEGYQDGKWASLTISPGASATLKVVAKVKQLGTVTNTATVKLGDSTKSDTATVNGTEKGEILIRKRRTTDEKVKVGETIRWTITVTNNSNVSKTGTLTDEMAWGTKTEPFTLEPNETITFEASYVTKDKDVGQTVHNTVVGKVGGKEIPVLDEGTKVTGYIVTVKYEDEDGNTIKEPDTVDTSEKKGQYDVSGKTETPIEGYEYKEVKDDKPLEGTATGDLEIVLVYAKKYNVSYSWTGLPEEATAKWPEKATIAKGNPVEVDTEFTNGTEVTFGGKTYKFSGWSTTDVTFANGKFIMPGKDVAITGEWTEKAPEPSNPTTPSTTRNLTVNKVWAGDEEALDARPDSIQVQLYLSGAAYGSPVTLSAANGWRYTWLGLPALGTLTVEELNIPDGYTATQVNSVSNVTITNTYTDEEIEDPEVPMGTPKPTPTPTPAPSEKPTPGPSATPDPGDEPIEDPEVPMGTPKPEPTPDPDEEIEDPDVPMGTPKPVKPSTPDDEEEIPDGDVPMANTPKTGDDSGIWMTLALVSAAGLVFLGISRRKKGENVR